MIQVFVLCYPIITNCLSYIAEAEAIKVNMLLVRKGHELGFGLSHMTVSRHAKPY